MGKWADYLISKVRYNEARTRIVKVRVHRDKGDKVEEASSIWSRKEVVSSIEGGHTFCTIKIGSDEECERGADVHIVTVDGEKFLRTDKNEVKADNLGELPEF